jgi:uncharacterized protein VirK/YbjX
LKCENSIISKIWKSSKGRSEPIVSVSEHSKACQISWIFRITLQNFDNSVSDSTQLDKEICKQLVSHCTECRVPLAHSQFHVLTFSNSARVRIMCPTLCMMYTMAQTVRISVHRHYILNVQRKRDKRDWPITRSRSSRKVVSLLLGSSDR